MKLLASTLMLLSSIGNADELRTVASLELDKYLGLWNEIASIPQIFQAGCSCTQARYSPRDNGEVKIENTCRLGGSGGFPINIEGTARIPDATESAKLKVRFFSPAEADYWVMAVGPDYSYALVGTPDRQSLWLLAREKTLPEATYNELTSLAVSQGYSLDGFKLTNQAGCQ